jgi:hypothetical protein
MWKLLRSRGRVCLPWPRSSPSPWVGRGGDRRLRSGRSPSPGVGRSGVRRLLGLSPSPSPRSGGAEFAVFRGLARVRALGWAEWSSSSSGAEPKSEPWVGRSGVRCLPGLCDGTSQVIRPTYSCPCLSDIRHPVDVPKSLDKFGIFPYLTRNVSPVL